MYDLIVQGIPVHGRVLGDVLRCEYVFEEQKYFVDFPSGNGEGKVKIEKRIWSRVASELFRHKINRDERRFHKVLESGVFKKEKTRRQWAQERGRRRW